MSQPTIQSDETIAECRCCEQCQAHREWMQSFGALGKPYHSFGPPPPYSELIMPTNFDPQSQLSVCDQDNFNCYQTDFDPNCKLCNINLPKE